MLHPSYTDLMKLVNSEVESGEAPVVNSRYSIVLATSKRARQIIDGAETYVIPKCPKPLSVAIDELNNSKIRILSEEEAAEVEARKAAEAAIAFKEQEEAIGTEKTDGVPDSLDEEDGGNEAGFVCTVCGYVYKGSTLPEDFICPVCRNGEETYPGTGGEEMADTVTATSETRMPEDTLKNPVED
ncbi:MAG: DNA-directed RNA polymerase subunit omega [Lachnospiraceae bacterium]